MIIFDISTTADNSWLGAQLHSLMPPSTWCIFGICAGILGDTHQHLRQMLPACAPIISGQRWTTPFLQGSRLGIDVSGRCGRHVPPNAIPNLQMCMRL
jgi:hypothetical protein